MNSHPELYIESTANTCGKIILMICSDQTHGVIIIHYVSMVQKKCGKNKNSLRNLKSKLTMGEEKKRKKLAYYSVYQKYKGCSRN